MLYPSDHVSVNLSLTLALYVTQLHLNSIARPSLGTTRPGKSKLPQPYLDKGF